MLCWLARLAPSWPVTACLLPGLLHPATPPAFKEGSRVRFNPCISSESVAIKAPAHSCDLCVGPVYWRHPTRCLARPSSSRASFALSGLDCNDKTRRAPSKPNAGWSPFSVPCSTFVPNARSTTYLSTLDSHSPIHLLLFPARASETAKQAKRIFFSETGLGLLFSYLRENHDSAPRCSSHSAPQVAGQLALPDLLVSFRDPARDTMTVALLVSRPGNMPGYNTAVELNEVQSLSRYCFFFFTLTIRIVFLSSA